MPVWCVARPTAAPCGHFAALPLVRSTFGLRGFPPISPRCGSSTAHPAGRGGALPRIDGGAGRKVGQLTVEFRGWVPKVGENPTTLMFHWCAVDSLDAIEFADWIAVSDGYYSGVENGSQLMIPISGRDFRGRKFIGLKWSVKNQAKSSLLAISDLRVTADLDQPGFALLVR